MKIDFENLRMYEGIDKQNISVLNVKKVFADELYTRGQGIACHALALKIFNSEGETEFSDEEYFLIVEFAKQVCTPKMIDALQSLKPEEKEIVEQ